MSSNSPSSAMFEPEPPAQPVQANTTTTDNSNNNCLAAEILTTGHSRYYRTEIVVVDQNDTIFCIGFLPTCGEVPKEYFKRRCTMLIINPVRVRMGDGIYGLEVHDLKTIKVLPFRMAYPVGIAQRIYEQKEIVDMKRECYGCKKRKFALHRCPRCKLFYFCNRKCQMHAFFSLRHRAECGVLRDPDMNALLTGNGHTLGGFEYFHLNNMD